jgi:hypothetical protein
MNPPGTISIRPATQGDVAQLCELLAILFAQEADFTPDTDRQTRGLRLILEQPRLAGFFAQLTVTTSSAWSAFCLP